MMHRGITPAAPAYLLRLSTAASGGEREFLRARTGRAARGPRAHLVSFIGLFVVRRVGNFPARIRMCPGLFVSSRIFAWWWWLEFQTAVGMLFGRVEIFCFGWVKCGGVKVFGRFRDGRRAMVEECLGGKARWREG